MKKQYIYVLGLIFIFLLGFFLRFYKLGGVPFGLYQDETAIGYNAYSILATGKDEHTIAFPLYFKSFGDYKLPVYIYLTAAAIKLFGLTEFAVRLPSALFGSLTILLIYFLVKKITEHKTIALFTTFLVAINPWHLHYSRASFEVSVSLFLFVVGTLLLVQSSKKNNGAFFAGTICFVLNLYSYNLTRMLSPLLFLLTLYFLRSNLRVSRKELILTCIVGIIFIMPFFATLNTRGGASSVRGTLIFSSAAVQAPLIEFRSYLVNLPSWWTKPLFNSLFLNVGKYVGNLASYLSVPFFYINGSSHGNHGIGTVGQYYLFELPLFLIGIFVAIRKKSLWRRLIFFWIAATIGTASLTREVPHATRSFFLIFPMELLTSFGLIQIIQSINRLRSHTMRIVSLTSLTLIGFYSIAYYFTSYYEQFPISYAKSWRSSDKDLSLFIKSIESDYTKVIFDTHAGFVYTSYLFFTKFSPALFQKTATYLPDDSEGFSDLLSFGKYEFRSIDWDKDVKSPSTLIITSVDQKPLNVPPLKAFYYPKRPVVIAVKQEIFQYPAQDIGYIVVSSR